MTGTLINDQTAGVLAAMLDRLPLGAVVAVDTETTGLHMYEDDKLRGISLAFHYLDGIQSFYIPVGYPEGNLSLLNQGRIFGALRERKPFLVLHHGKFDFAFLRQLTTDRDGISYFPFPEPHRWWDTKVVSWLLDENMPTGLKENAEFYWGKEERAEQDGIKKLVKEKGWGGLTAADTAEYAAKDTELTLRLYERQLQIIEEHGPTVLGDIRPAIERELAKQAVLFRMEQTGILVNPALIEMMRADTEKVSEKIEREFDEVHRVNLSSPKQLADFLYGTDETSKVRARQVNPKTGRMRWVTVPAPWDPGLGLEPPKKGRSTDRAALERLENKHELVARIMLHRRLKKALTGYLVPLGERIGYDGRIHPSFSSTGTVTGRLSCSQPNLQTIPRADTLKGVRDVFIAEDGFELWEYDLSAAEMRVVAGMAGETVLIDALNEGIDMHGALAAEVFGPNYTGLQRRYAKNVGYGWFYGLTKVETAAKYIAGEDGEAIAAKILNGLKKRYRKVYRLMNLMSREAAKKGILPVGDAWPGRFRHFQTPSARRAPAYTALNALVQGGIGEFMLDVMLMAEYELGRVGARICLQVHDSLVIEVPVGRGKEVQEILQTVADDVNPFAMPMIFDASPWEAHD